MSDKKHAAIDLDEFMDQPIEKISATEFLAALGTGRAELQYIRFWPEKKKYELYTEPEGPVIAKASLREIIDKLRGEKKKVEREVIDFDHLIYPPELYQDLVRDVTREVAKRIGR